MHRRLIPFGLCLSLLGVPVGQNIAHRSVAIAQPAPTAAAPLITLADLPEGFTTLRQEWFDDFVFDTSSMGMEIAGLFIFQRLQPRLGNYEVVLGGTLLKPDMRDEITTESGLSDFADVVGSWLGVAMGETEEQTEWLEGVGDRATRTIMTFTPLGFPTQINMILFEYNSQVSFMITFHPQQMPSEVNDVGLAQLMIERL
ncbi:MAG: hypothetical protein AAGG51_09110 [Cyanobacteria bacterium P01_G01_bin.54]